MIEFRHKIARNAGFENYRDYTFKAMHLFDYTPTDCEAFHQGAAEVCVPVFRQLNKQRAEALGVAAEFEEGLRGGSKQDVEEGLPMAERHGLQFAGQRKDDVDTGDRQHAGRIYPACDVPASV